MLTDAQLDQQDYVDNSIVTFVSLLAEHHGYKNVPHDMEFIAPIREDIFRYLYKYTNIIEAQFYPYEEDNDI